MGPIPVAAAKHVATRNILNPLLFLCAIVSCPAIVGAAFASGPLLTALLVAFGVPPVFTLLAYCYWTFKDPNRLQSEQFILQQRWMDAQPPQIGDNRTHEVIDVSSQETILAPNKVHGKDPADA